MINRRCVVLYITAATAARQGARLIGRLCVQCICVCVCECVRLQLEIGIKWRLTSALGASLRRAWCWSKGDKNKQPSDAFSFDFSFPSPLRPPVVSSDCIFKKSSRPRIGPTTGTEKKKH